MARPVLGVRLDSAHHARLDRLIERTPGTDRACVAREAMRRGLETLELEHASGRPVSLRVHGEDGVEATEEIATMNETNGTPKAIKALAMIPALEAQIPLQPADAHTLAELIKARAALEMGYDALVGARAARARLAKYREHEKQRKQREADEKAIRDLDERQRADAATFERMKQAAEEARARVLVSSGATEGAEQR